uniref:protein-serine/threonine phosphatase n=1 Tax=Palpitomonas bilix TaxID=652834 RepID=A0A7S3G2V9_9EUKA|mmetsp:Transcript_24442/g.61860  ORF Transcript_24442/g.61860 Transcript_24442/m.61860 type:complete len:336 (+) Transcript_24442:272-1279(+)
METKVAFEEESVASSQPLNEYGGKPQLSAGWATVRNNILSKGGINEDRLYTRELLDKNGADGVRLIGVFDGHGGSEAADYLIDHLQPAIRSSKFYPRDLPACLRDAFIRTDVSFIEEMGAVTKCGSTALSIAMEGSILYLANVGDCRAVIGHADGTPSQLTEDLNCENQKEVERIEKMGGRVVGGRVYGSLAVTRSIGDGDFKFTRVEMEETKKKSNPFAYQERSMRSFLPQTYLNDPHGTPTMVSAIPEITVHHLSQQDRFLVAATDGLWNLMSNEEVVDFVQAGLMPKCGSGRGLPSPKRITKVAQSLLEHAVKKRAHDDVTVVIIVFDTAKM